MKRFRLGLLVLAMLVVAGAAAGAAAADPANARNSAPVTITCGSTIYNAVVNGNGLWAPAHDLNSNRVLIPVAFGVQTTVVTDSSGTTTSTDPAQAKGGSAPHGGQAVSCSYHLAFSFPGGSVAIDGTVTGFVTPANG
jgi:hypothetical protein